MDIIIFLLGITLGFFSFTFIGLQIVLTNTVSAKLIKQDINKGFTANYCTIYRKMLTTVALCSYLLYGTIVLANILGHLLHSDVFVIIYFVGWGFSLLFSIGKLGTNLNNITDYYRTYRKEYAATSFPPHGYKYTLFYKLRFLILFLLILPQPVISALINDGRSLGAVPMVLLWEPAVFFVSNWHNAFSPARKITAPSTNVQTLATHTLNPSTSTTQTFEYNKDSTENSIYNNDIKTETRNYTHADISLQPATGTTIKQPTKKLSKGEIAIIAFLSTFLAAMVIGISVYVGILIGQYTSQENEVAKYHVDYSEEVVYVTDSGEYYHSTDCDFIHSVVKRGRGAIYTINEINKSDAIKKGFKRCNKCNP